MSNEIWVYLWSSKPLVFFFSHQGEFKRPHPVKQKNALLVEMLFLDPVNSIHHKTIILQEAPLILRKWGETVILWLLPCLRTWQCDMMSLQLSSNMMIAKATVPSIMIKVIWNYDFIIIETWMILFRKRSLFLSRVIQLKQAEEIKLSKQMESKENKTSSLLHREKMHHPDNQSNNSGLKLHNMNSNNLEIPAWELFLNGGFQDNSQGQSQNPVRATKPPSLNIEDGLFSQLSPRNYCPPQPPSASLPPSMLSNSKSPSHFLSALFKSMRKDLLNWLITIQVRNQLLWCFWEILIVNIYKILGSFGIEKVGKSKRGRPRKNEKKVTLPPLYVFIRNLLHKISYNPDIVSWLNETQGIFRVNNSLEFAKTW